MSELSELIQQNFEYIQDLKGELKQIWILLRNLEEKTKKLNLVCQVLLEDKD